MPERCRRDHVDLDSPLPHPLDGVGDEIARRIALIARVRRGQYDDFHWDPGSRRLFENTAGAASASIAKT